MTTLAQWQAGIAAVIDAERPATLPDRAAMPVPGPSIVQGCAVYRGNSRQSRAAVLEEVYPVCRRVLGERSFGGLAREFVRRHASRHNDLNRFGAGFADFARETVATQSVFAGLVWLPDLARLEWFCHDVYYRDDDAPLDLSPLQTRAASAIWPRPVRALAWLHSEWPVHEILAAHRAPGEPPAIRLEHGNYHLVVERRDYRARVAVVSATLWALLDACGRGRLLADIAADPQLDISALGDLVARRWIGALDLPGRVV